MIKFTVLWTFPWGRGICSCLSVRLSKPSQSLLCRPLPSSRSNASNWLLFPPSWAPSSQCWPWVTAPWWSSAARSWTFGWSGDDWGWHWWSKRRRSWELRSSCVWWMRTGCVAADIGFHRWARASASWLSRGKGTRLVAWGLWGREMQIHMI